MFFEIQGAGSHWPRICDLAAQLCRISMGLGSLGPIFICFNFISVHGNHGGLSFVEGTFQGTHTLLLMK